MFEIIVLNCPRFSCPLFLITHAGIAAGVVWHSVTSVCLFVRSLTGKRLELSTPNLVHLYSIAVTRHVSKGHRSRSRGYKNRSTVASDHGRYSIHQYAAVLPATVAGVGLHVDKTAYVFYFSMGSE